MWFHCVALLTRASKAAEARSRVGCWATAAPSI